MSTETNMRITTQWSHGPNRCEGTMTADLPGGDMAGNVPTFHVQIMAADKTKPPNTWNLLASFNHGKRSVTIEDETFGSYRDAQEAGKNRMLDILTMFVNPIRVDESERCDEPD